MTADTAPPAFSATARNVMDRIRYMVLGTIRGRVYPHLAGVHSHNLKRDNRLSAVIFDSTVPPGSV